MNITFKTFEFSIRQVVGLLLMLLMSVEALAYDFEVDGLYYNKLSSNQVEVTYNKEEGNSYSGILAIPEKVKYNGNVYVVTSIGSDAFFNCSSLTSITIPNSVKSIGSYVFAYCSGLTSITISNSLANIGSYAFLRCRGLNSITIPNSVTSIGSSAFVDCSSLTSIKIPNNVTAIGSSVFGGCNRLTSISVGSGNAKYDSRNNCNAIIETSSNTLIAGCKYTIIPNNVTTIGSDAFWCSNLTSITIPVSVTTIGNRAFYLCSGLTSIIIPNSVTAIGKSAFAECRGLISVKSYIANPYNITDVFEHSTSLVQLQVPKGTKSKYEALSGWAKYFKEIVEFDESPTTYTLSITASGNGSASYGGSTIRGKTSLFTVNAGASATITFTPDNGYRIKSVKVNNTTVSVSNNQYTVSSINTNTTVSVEFEAIPPTTYTLSITASGNGSASYSGTTIRSKTSSFTLNAGSSATITFTPDNGYRIKSVKVNNTTVSVSNNQYTISSINSNTTVSVEFEAIPIYTLSIKATGNGSASYDEKTIREETKSFTLEAGTNANITFSPDNGYSIKNVMMDGSDVTSMLSNNTYSISNISKNTSIEVEFEQFPLIKEAGEKIKQIIEKYNTAESKLEELCNALNNSTISTEEKEKFERRVLSYSDFTPIQNAIADLESKYAIIIDAGGAIEESELIAFLSKINDVDSYIDSIIKIIEEDYEQLMFLQNNSEEQKTFESGGINYSVSSYNDKTVIVVGGDYVQVLEVPANVTYDNVKWKVAGIDKEALANKTKLAAIIWNPAAEFTLNVSNPNLLLYVTSASYAPASITNVIVNNTANKIILSDASSNNDFYCPKEFTAKSINYTHNYCMTTGKGESRGWETIVLPFDVKKVSHSTKGEIIPFASWKNGDSKKPFWLMTYGTGGWTEANSIKANTPYIISMPNNPDYKSEFRLSGNVTFSAENVTVKKTENLEIGSSGGKTLRPNFANEDNSGCYALNVNNDYVTYNGGSNEGSTFVLNLRPLHPFEAYMTTASNSARSIAISDDMITGIEEITTLLNEQGVVRVYNLQGQQLKIEAGKSIEDVKRLLPAGVYIINGKKQIIK